MKTVAIKPIAELDDIFLGHIKQSLLLFDKIGVPFLDNLLSNLKDPQQAAILPDYIKNEIELLSENGYLFDAWQKEVKVKNSLDMKALNDADVGLLLNLLSRDDIDPKISREALARLCATSLKINDPHTNAIPLTKILKLPSDIKKTNSEIINIIIDKMPIPDEKTPWEKILDFKSDPDNIGKFTALKLWISKSLRSELQVSEIKDELDYLLFQYRKSLEIHSIKYNYGFLQSILISSLELIENTMKLKFSNIAKDAFQIRQSKVDLLNSELTSPGSELAYIYEAQRTFV